MQPPNPHSEVPQSKKVQVLLGFFKQDNGVAPPYQVLCDMYHKVFKTVHPLHQGLIDDDWMEAPPLLPAKLHVQLLVLTTNIQFQVVSLAPVHQ